MNFLQAFFNTGRQKLSFHNPLRYSVADYDLAAFCSGNATKLKCLIAMCRLIILQGPEFMVAEEYRGEKDTILTTEELGLGDLIHNYQANPILPQQRQEKSRKIVVFTVFAKFHGYIERVSPRPFCFQCVS